MPSYIQANHCFPKIDLACVDVDILSFPKFCNRSPASDNLTNSYLEASTRRNSSIIYDLIISFEREVGEIFGHQNSCFQISSNNHFPFKIFWSKIAVFP